MRDVDELSTPGALSPAANEADIEAAMQMATLIAIDSSRKGVPTSARTNDLMSNATTGSSTERPSISTWICRQTRVRWTDRSTDGEQARPTINCGPKRVTRPMASSSDPSMGQSVADS